MSITHSHSLNVGRDKKKGQPKDVGLVVGKCKPNDSLKRKMDCFQRIILIHEKKMEFTRKALILVVINHSCYLLQYCIFSSKLCSDFS